MEKTLNKTGIVNFLNDIVFGFPEIGENPNLHICSLRATLILR